MTSCSFCHIVSECKLASCVCGKAFYCNKECQVKDWKHHKLSCPPYNVKDVPEKGRGLFATRKIKPGQVILDERPITTMRDANITVNSLQEVTGFDKEIKASILQLHDPADNLKNLEAKDVDQLKREQPIYSMDTEAGKIVRIFSNNCITICVDSDVTNNTAEVGLYPNISLINHSCNPNVMWSWVRGDIKRKQVRAMKLIEKDEEILACYQNVQGDDGFGSRETRQQTLLKTHAFLCSCSDCSLEGDELEENERIRAEIREKRRTIISLISGRSLLPYNVKRAVKLSQEFMVLVKKLNIQPQVVDRLLQIALPVAWVARNEGLRGPDPRSILQEALEFCQKFGDSMMKNYNDFSRDYS